MKKLFIVLMLFTLASCKEPNVETTNSSHIIGTFGHTLDVVKIEGCEYFFADYDRSSLFTHKGNCNNPIHKLKQQEQ
jgi:hypothetical protein